jgi:membrane-bound inhibitor of C-type lysozyme
MPLGFRLSSGYLWTRGEGNLKKRGIWAVLLTISLALCGFAAASAQTTTFQRYRCSDGTQFVVGFYPYDDRAHMQIDGSEVTLFKRLALTGTRYSGAGVVLQIGKAGATTVKHARRPATACEPFSPT